MDTKKIPITWLICLLSFIAILQACNGEDSAGPWGSVNSMVAGIKKTSFPDRVFNIIDYGAVANDENMDWEAIKQAVKICSGEGGGKVLVPSGLYFSGPITFHDNVNLHLEEGAIIKFSTNPEDYLPVVRTRWEGMDCYNYSPLVYAYRVNNIAITGKGVLDGRANNENWWFWKGKVEFGWKDGMPSQLDTEARPSLLSMMKNGTDVEQRIFGEGGYLRPPFIQFFQCNTVLMEDVTVKNSPFWLIHPLLSENIILRRVKAISHGPNNDGIDPESSRNVLIEDCEFDNGDDCIAIKSGRNEDGRKWGVPSENILVRNCKMKNGHGGVVIGSEISGGCRNVFVENCMMDSPELDRAIRIKTNSFRGGIIENMYVRNLEIGQVDEAVIKINCHYEIKDGEIGAHLPLVRNILIEDISSEKSEYAIFIQGIEGEDVIQNIVIRNAKFKGVDKGNFIESASHPELNEVYINEILVEK